MDGGGPAAVEAGRVRRERGGGHSAVGWGHRGHLPLEQLQNDVNVCRHTSLQPVKMREINDLSRRVLITLSKASVYLTQSSTGFLGIDKMTHITFLLKQYAVGTR